MHTHTKTITSESTTETFVEKICPSCFSVFSVTTKPKRGPKQKYCKHRCGTDYYCNNVRDKNSERIRMATYFSDNPEKRFLASTKQSAKERGLSFDLTAEWFKERLGRGICEVTGLPIKIKLYKAHDKGNRGFYSPSIDRIDNTVGYIVSNCRLVCWGYNLGKNKFTDRDLNALAVSLLVQSVPKMAKDDLLKLIPNTLLASLPSGHCVF
ncbi:MAG: hypothetical protein ABL903_19520 [Methylococcales bacterium]